jgi:membrane protease YdiL (CAAX protease family)
MSVRRLIILASLAGALFAGSWEIGSYLLLLAIAETLSPNSVWKNLGAWPPQQTWSNHFGGGVLAIVGASGGGYISLSLLSFVSPTYVDWALELTGDATLGALLTTAVLAPFVEELLFRGLLLRKFISKWGARKGILLSSAAFALLHPDPVGAFLFGAVMSIIALQTGELWIVIALHTLNNIVGIASDLFQVGSVDLSDLQSTMWIGLACLAIGLLPLVRVLKKGFQLQRGSQVGS